MKDYDKLQQIEYRLNTASEESIYDHLVRCASIFKPRLDSYVNIKEYALKIYSIAERIEAWVQGNLVGLLAVYLNNEVSKEGFITNVSVEKDYHGRSIGSELLRRSLALAAGKGFISVKLEVFSTNKAALRMYEKFGFVIERKEDMKILMRWLNNGKQI